MRNLISVELRRDCEAVQIPEDSGLGISFLNKRRARVCIRQIGFDNGGWLTRLHHFGWGRSSVGRAPQWHCGGQGFESPRLHHSENCSEKEAQTWPSRL